MRTMILLLAAVSLLAVLVDCFCASGTALHDLCSGMAFISLALLTVVQFMYVEEHATGKLRPI